MVYDSVYEANNYLRGTARKQHFWDWFSGSKLQESETTTTDEDFSSSTGWTKTPSSTSYWNIASNKLSWDTRIASTGQGYNYDLTSDISGVSNLDGYSTWVLRFEMVVTGGTNLNNDCLTTFGISSNNDFTSGTGGQYSSSRSHIMIQCAVLDPNANTRTLQMKAENGTSMGQQQTPNIAFSDNTTYYVEIKKTGATSYTVSWTSNSDYVTSTNSKDFTGLTLTGLKYLHMESWLQGSQTQYESRSQGYIDNLKFYTVGGIRWTTSDITHTGTYSMVDEADEGFSILSSTSGARSALGFNNIRQFFPTASVAIFNLKRMTDASHDSYAGFKYDDTNSTFYDTAVVSQASYATNIGLYTGDASTATNLESTTPRDTAWHGYKIENGSANIKLTIDGVVNVTKTLYRPSKQMQPFVLNSTNTSATRETRINYFEAYNT